MLNNYYTLRALACEWALRLEGSTIADVYSQSRGELAIVLGSDSVLQFVLRPPLVCAFERHRSGRRRRNVASLFPELTGQVVTGICVADGDRILTIHLEHGLQMRAYLFGSQANVYVTDGEGLVRNAFRGADSWTGRRTAPPRRAAVPEAFEVFRARLRNGTMACAIRGAVPFLDSELASEVLRRADLADGPVQLCSESDMRALFAAVKDLDSELEHPSARILWSSSGEAQLALGAVAGPRGAREERFDTVNRAVRVLAQYTLARQAFLVRYRSISRVIDKGLAAAQRRESQMRREQSSQCRHGDYERWAHLLMASRSEPPGQEQVVLEDLFGGGTPVTIALEASLGTVANAERYYQKARKARQAREYLATRLHQAERLGQELARAREELSHVSHLDGLDAFERANLGLIQRLQSRGGEVAGSRFRRFSVGQGYAVWVSRSQREADDLTFRCARKYDLWMHARGYSGAHVVLRLPHRDAAPGALLVEKAASIAAYFSKGRHSAFVPVIVTPRKYVHKPRGAPPGMVTCIREEVVIVAPESPLE